MPRSQLVTLASFFGLALVFPLVAPYEALASEILIFALLAMSYDLVLGYGGMLSFGHAAFFGIGAYTTGILLIRVIPSVPLAVDGGYLRKWSGSRICRLREHQEAWNLFHDGDLGLRSDVLFHSFQVDRSDRRR